MAKKKKLSDEKLSAIIKKAISNSEHLNDGKLSREREEVDRYYKGELPAPLHKGDSKYVSRDVFDTVDSMRATVLEPFSTNSRIVYFRPELGDTVADSKQATDYTRHVVFKDNGGEDILYEVLTDGLKARVAYVKVYFEEIVDETEYEFEGLTTDELELEVAEYKDYDFNDDITVSQNGLYSGTFTVRDKKQKVVIETIQPEDLLISNSAKSIEDARYVIHRTPKSRSYFVEKYGQKVAESLAFNKDSVYAFDFEKQSRFEPVEHLIGSNDAYDESVEETTLYEVYIKMDMDGSGINKLWRVDYACGEILAKEQVSRKPFAAFIPLPVPHTFFGENFAKSVIPIQNARTVLFRQIINHSLITNNPRQQVLNGTLLNPQELLENRMGGIVNVRRIDGIAPIPQAPLNPFIFNLLQMLDEDKEEVTGISKLSQGMNKDAISTQNAEGMIEQLISASQQRTKVIARRFGLFIRELYCLVYNTAVDHITEETFIETTGAYVPVNPSQWKQRSAASIELTLGYGEQAKESQKWIEVDAAFKDDPELKPLYSIDKRYEVITRALEARGIEDVRSILTPPEEIQPPQPSEMELLQIEALKVNIDYQKAQAEAMRSKAKTDNMRAQAELIKAQTDAAYKKTENEIEAKRLENDIYVDQEELKLASSASEQKAVYNP